MLTDDIGGGAWIAGLGLPMGSVVEASPWLTAAMRSAYNDDFVKRHFWSQHMELSYDTDKDGKSAAESLTRVWEMS